MKTNIKTALDKAHEYILQASKMGLDMAAVLSKIEQAIALTSSDIVTIALLGSVSDGKTTTISGLIGQQLDNMKIDTNESSDEIEVYEVPFLNKTFRFVDTPGLFGTREKKMADGSIKRFSSITEDYIAQANIVIYVTEVSNPLPDSHQAALRYVMRDLRKLDNAIFIINKMDQKYDTLDEEEFAEGVVIKKQNLKERLERCLNLTSLETNQLNIICIAANPNDKGLPYWFEKAQAYEQRSHISVLKDQIIKATDQVNCEDANEQAALATAADALNQMASAIEIAETPIKTALRRAEPMVQDSFEQLSHYQRQIAQSKAQIMQQIENIETEIRQSVECASVETIGSVINSEIGCSDEGINFSIVIRKINNAFASCCENVKTISEQTCNRISTKIESSDEMIQKALKDGAVNLKGINVSPDFVGKMRDIFFKDFKFKPWGKIKLAQNIGKWAGRAAMGIGFVIEAYGWYKKWKAKENLKELKPALQNELTKIFNEAHRHYYDEASFIENFAPSYIEMQNALDEKKAELDDLSKRVSEMEQRRAEIRQWKKDNIQDVEFTNI